LSIIAAAVAAVPAAGRPLSFNKRLLPPLLPQLLPELGLLLPLPTAFALAAIDILLLVLAEGLESLESQVTPGVAALSLAALQQLWDCWCCEVLAENACEKLSFITGMQCSLPGVAAAAAAAVFERGCGTADTASPSPSEAVAAEEQGTLLCAGRLLPLQLCIGL
jgi:hypothetical protein